MSNDSQSDQHHVIGEMFDAANIAQPSPSPTQSIPGSITVDNIQPPSEQRGFTVDNIQQPAPQPDLPQEDNDE